MSWIERVNRYWFVELDAGDWFSARPEIDEEIRSRFAALHAVLRRALPDAQRLSAEGHVAAVLVFDQFSRNLYRGLADTYATDDLALSLATHAVDGGLDAALTAHHRQFLYMPLMHSEDRATQARSVQLFRALDRAFDDLDVTRYAEHHQGIVERFGRFPHRNEILGRASTADERDFLNADR